MRNTLGGILAFVLDVRSVSGLLGIADGYDIVIGSKFVEASELHGDSS
jgi:hypothetical protein